MNKVPVTFDDLKDEDFAQGKDNYGHPRSQYVQKVLAMTESQYLKETENKIWLSAYAANNRTSDYHWHVDALHRIGEHNFPGLYDQAFQKASAS